MGVVIKQSIRSILFTLIGVILGVIINVLSMKVFHKTEYGFTQNLIKIALQVCYLSLFGINFAVIIYGQKFPPGHHKRSTFLAISLIIPIIMTCFMTILFFIFKEQFIKFYNSGDEALLREFFVLFPILTLFAATQSWLEGYLQSINKSSIQSFAKEGLSRIIYIILIALVAGGILNYHNFLWWYVGLFSIPIIYLIYHSARNDGFEFKYKSGLFSKKEIWQIIQFSGNQMFIIVSIVLILQIDAILLGPLDTNGFEAIAVYGIATFAISIIKNPIRALSIAAMPSLAYDYQNIKLKSLKTNFLKSAVTMQIASLFLGLLMVVNISDIQSILNLIKPGYEQVQYLILLLLIGQIVDIFGGLNMEVITLSKYYRFNTWASLLMLAVIIVLNIILIKQMGIYGAAIATSSGLILYSIMKITFVWKKLKIFPFSSKTILLLIVGGVCTLLCYWLNVSSNPFVNLGIKSAVFCIIYGVTVYKLKISTDINQILQKFLPFLK